MIELSPVGLLVICVLLAVGVCGLLAIVLVLLGVFFDDNEMR